MTSKTQHGTWGPLGFALLAIASATAACSEPPPGPPDGVDRIENRDVGMADARVPDAPAVVIGGVEEVGSPHLLGRVGSIGRLRDGRIVLVETTTQEVRVFDRMGEHVWSFGGRGDGPGEFRQPRYLGQASDDSLLIWDDGQARMTSLTPSGELDRTRTAGSLVEQIPPRPRAILTNDMLVGSFPGEGAPDDFEHGEIVRDFSRIYLTDLDYSNRTYVTELTGATFQVFLTPDLTFVASPFTSSASFSASGDHVVAVGPDERGVSLYSGEGSLVREMWVDRPQRTVTEGDWAQEVARRLADIPDEERANEERSLQRLDVPDVMPVYDRVLDDGSSRIWARQYLVRFSDARYWDVFSRDGQFQGSVETPARLNVAQVGADWVLGIYYDEFMVPSVRMHPIEGGMADR